MIEGDAARGDDSELVGLGRNPGVGDLETGLVEVRELAGRCLREAPVGLVNNHLRNGYRVGAVVQHRCRDAVRGELHSLEDELFHWRCVAPNRLCRVGLHYQPEQTGQEKQRNQRHQPDRRSALASYGFRFVRHQALSTASKKPIQPSSANSLWWA